MTFTPIISGPVPDADEVRLRQLENLIAQAEAEERREAERKAEEERQRAARAVAAGGLTLDDLRARREELAALIARRQHHLQADAERELLERRADRLRADRESHAANATRVDHELARIEAMLHRSS